MFSTKIRTTIIGLVASAGFAGALVAPAASQAQWHTYCVAGHCITHSNYTIGGVDPCTGIQSNYNTAYEGLLDAVQDKKEQEVLVNPEMTPAEAQAQIEAAEAQVHQAELASFEWGCQLALQTSPTSGVTSTSTLQTSATLSPSLAL
jgi:hypothetical protein